MGEESWKLLGDYQNDFGESLKQIDFHAVNEKGLKSVIFWHFTHLECLVANCEGMHDVLSYSFHLSNRKSYT